jgi:hypothetical protein
VRARCVRDRPFNTLRSDRSEQEIFVTALIKPGGPGFDAETPDGGVLANWLLMGIPYCFISPLGRAESPPGTELPQVAGTSLGDWRSFGESRPALPRRPRR